MVLTQLEARVAPGQWEAMKQAYHNIIQQVPSAIYQTYLIQDDADREIWSIITVWQNRQTL